MATQHAGLCERLQRLYGHTPHFDDWLGDLFAAIEAAALARPGHLVTLDNERLQNPTWHQSEKRLGYCCYVDRFGRTLKGLEARIPHLQALGVTYVHLLPFMQAGPAPNDGGFAVASFEDVSPELGSNQDLVHLIATFRNAGIGICYDFVLNHVSNAHPWALAAKQGDLAFKDYFYVLRSADQVADFERHLGQVFPGTAPGNFTYEPNLNAWVWTTFYPYQWDLNYSNPAVFLDITKAVLNLANLGLEAFRLDSTAFLWKRLGTPCMNLPQVHELLQCLRAIVQIAAPGVLLKAEAIVPTAALAPYFGNTDAPECHMAYHSSLMAASWYALQAQDTRILADVIDNTPALPEGTAWLTYVRCHDDIVWSVLGGELSARGLDKQGALAQAAQFFAGQVPHSYATGSHFQVSDPKAAHGTNGMCASLTGVTKARTASELNAAIDRIALLYALALFFGGMPVIYMGDELALQNIAMTAQDEALGNDGRQIHRPSWPDDAPALLGDPLSVSAQVYGRLSQLLKIRQNCPSLAANRSRQRVETGCAEVLGLLRDGTVHGFFNFSDRIQTLTSPQLPKALRGTALPAWSYLWHNA